MRDRPPVSRLPMLCLFAGLLVSLAPGAQAQAPKLLGTPVEAPVRALESEDTPPTPAARPTAGYSGRLRVAVVRALEAVELPVAPAAQSTNGEGYRWVPLFGADQKLLGQPMATASLQAPAAPGVWKLEIDTAYLGDASAGPVGPLTFITPVAFSGQRGGVLNGYHIGRYPAEGSGRTDRYAPPTEFIEVTRENQALRVSEHFELRQFLTKDQFDVWPKYLALDLRLIDKLELVLQELNSMGVRAEKMHVMSGFRTPQYNGPGGDGRATLSRHTYGDAADVWVDSDGNGYMDDLNGDGHSDIQDVAVMMRAVERVEKNFPALVGGAGQYVATSAHGPFIHIDVRGNRSRW